MDVTGDSLTVRMNYRKSLVLSDKVGREATGSLVIFLQNNTVCIESFTIGKDVVCQQHLYRRL